MDQDGKHILYDNHTTCTKSLHNLYAIISAATVVQAAMQYSHLHLWIQH